MARREFFPQPVNEFVCIHQTELGVEHKNRLVDTIQNFPGDSRGSIRKEIVADDGIGDDRDPYNAEQGRHDKGSIGGEIGNKEWLQIVEKNGTEDRNEKKPRFSFFFFVSNSFRV